MMNFEKISEAEYRKFWDENANPIESPQQAEERIQYFLNDLVLPIRKTGRAAGYDFTMPYDVFIKADEQILVGTGMKVSLADDKVLKIYMRSSYGINKMLMEANTVGIVDADYYNNSNNEGHIYVSLWNRSKKDILIRRGERFCQGIIVQYFVVDGDEYGNGPERKGGIGSTTVPLDENVLMSDKELKAAEAKYTKLWMDREALKKNDEPLHIFTNEELEKPSGTIKNMVINKEAGTVTADVEIPGMKPKLEKGEISTKPAQVNRHDNHSKPRR